MSNSLQLIVNHDQLHLAIVLFGKVKGKQQTLRLKVLVTDRHSLALSQERGNLVSEGKDWGNIRWVVEKVGEEGWTWVLLVSFVGNLEESGEQIVGQILKTVMLVLMVGLMSRVAELACLVVLTGDQLVDGAYWESFDFHLYIVNLLSSANQTAAHTAVAST